MKRGIKFSAFVLLSGVLFYISCKKEYSCEGCRGGNTAPIANAGPDEVITLPTDSVSLDGSASSDLDGMISSYLWTKISGPSSFNILRVSDSITKVKAFVPGTYQFELKVTDNGGLSAKDTMRVIVDSGLTTNHPPLANAGADQKITLPGDSVSIDGNGSTDPENNIISYAWSKISGPSSFNITNANTVQTLVSNLAQGTYQFELKVTDAEGLFSRDTIQLTVDPEPLSTKCVIGNRPLMNVQVVPFGTLSIARNEISVASAGNKILFAGGCISTVSGCVKTSRVDIYDIAMQNWSTAELSIPRSGLSAISCGSKILFISMYAGDPSSNVDIYDASTNTWSVTLLPDRRYLFSIASVSNKVVIAGGETPDGDHASDRVDIYNVSTNRWTTSYLSKGRWYMNALTANDKIYFAGGYHGSAITDTVNTSNMIDIYDNATGGWSTSLLNGLEWAGGGIAVANKIYWTGGNTINPDHGSNGTGRENMVEIRDLSTGNISFDCLSQPKGFLQAIEKDDKIIFFAPYSAGSINNWFDLYDITKNSWSIGLLSQSIYYSSPIISVNNKIFVAGGQVNNELSNQVWKLEF